VAATVLSVFSVHNVIGTHRYNMHFEFISHPAGEEMDGIISKSLKPQ
jgi:hypothetical protein